MDLVFRPMTVDHYGRVECAHWSGVDMVADYIERQGIASMLAFARDRCVGQLYLQEYDPAFREPAGWCGDRPWADFTEAGPLGLHGRLLTLGCYHVGWHADDSRDHALCGKGIGKALLRATVDWYRRQSEINGLLAWGLVAGSWDLLQWAGQMPHTVYAAQGFREIRSVMSSSLNQALPNIDTRGTDGPPSQLRVMILGGDIEARACAQ